jgi:hypothetical protein
LASRLAVITAAEVGTAARLATAATAKSKGFM